MPFFERTNLWNRWNCLEDHEQLETNVDDSTRDSEWSWNNFSCSLFFLFDAYIFLLYVSDFFEQSERNEKKLCAQKWPM